MKTVKYNAPVVGSSISAQPMSHQSSIVSSVSRRSFLRSSGAASVATVLALNGLTIDVRATGSSSGSTFKPDYEITFNTDTLIESLPGSLDLGSAQHYAEEYGASGADSGESTYDPATQEIDSSQAVSGSWSTTPTAHGSQYLVPAGTTLKFSGVRKAVAK